MNLQDSEFLTASEREIDLRLVEEITLCPAFQHWFTDAAGINPEYADGFVGAWHSVADRGPGESDLLFVWRSSSNRRFALLVQHKIDAPAQPDEGARYTQRGEEGVLRGEWDAFKTCLIAPSQYLGSSAEAKVCDCEISHEWLQEVFLSIGGCRSASPGSWWALASSDCLSCLQTGPSRGR